MNLTILLAVVVVFCLLFLLSLWHNSPRYKGKAGEAHVAQILAQLPEYYKTINDVVLSTGKRTTQIDHIVVSPYGVFTIETKNYRGDIYGDDYREKWTQIIVTEVTYARKWYKTYSYVKKSLMYNPVLQSKGHAYHISRIIRDIGNIPVIPIVVFTENANITNVNSQAHVIYASNLIGVIYGYNKQCITNEEVETIISRLQSANKRELITNEMHTTGIAELKQEKAEKIRLGRCPRCGSTLICRNGKYGPFMGCSNYPQCRFTCK